MLWAIQNPYSTLKPKELKRRVVRINEAVYHAGLIGFDELEM
jgi:hypothetical protein